MKLKLLKYIHVIFILLLFSINSWSQNPIFSQFYSAPLLLAPSFAGGTDGTRVSLNFRDQWPNLPGTFITYAFSIDHYFPEIRSGMGISFLKDVAGSGKLGYSSVAFHYSYNIKIFKNWRLRPGLALNRGKRSLDFHKLIFPDQTSINGVSTGSSIQSYTFPDLQDVRFLDAGASLLVYSRNIWFGTNFDHLNTPNESLMGTVVEMNILFSVFGGIKYVIKQKDKKAPIESLSFAFNFQMQDQAKQLDFGSFWRSGAYMVGLWYRGVPFLKNENSEYMSHDALIIFLGYRYYNFRIGYSYDFTISMLKNTTGGAHEISLIWEFNKTGNVYNKKWKNSVVNTPEFSF